MPKKSILKGVLLLFALAVLAGCASSSGSDGDDLSYLPQGGDQVIVFTHRFNPDDYEAGKAIVIDGFSQAMQASGQTRRTYFLDNPDDHIVVAISFFHVDSSPEEWMDGSQREEVLAQLQALYREPLEIEELVVEEVHDTN